MRSSSSERKYFANIKLWIVLKLSLQFSGCCLYTLFLKLFLIISYGNTFYVEEINIFINLFLN